MKIFLLLIPFLFIFKVNAQLTPTEKKELLVLVKFAKKNYRFYAKKNKNYYLLGGTWSKQTDYENIFNPKNDSLEETDKNKLIQMVWASYLKGHELYVASNDFVFELQKGKKTKQIYPIENIEEKWIDQNTVSLDKEKLQKNSITKNHCTYCKFQVMGKLVSMEGKTMQFSPEIAYPINSQFASNFGITFALSASGYLMEDEDLQKIYTPLTNIQLLPRIEFNQNFMELGGGLQYLFSPGALNTIYTIGFGHIFNTSVISQETSFTPNNILLQWSRSNYRNGIKEIKLGLGFIF